LRPWLGGTLALTAGLDLLVGVAGTVLAGVLALDPARGWLVTGVRELVVLALSAGGPLLACLLCLAAAGALIARSPMGPWLTLVAGIVHLGVPFLGLPLCAGAAWLLRRDREAV
jgi:hypothetical protein